MVRLLTGKAPRLSKEKEKKLRNSGILLCRNASGRLYFRIRNFDQFSSYAITSKGEEWLQQQTYREGDRIDRRIVNELRDWGYVEPSAKSPTRISVSPSAKGKTSLHRASTQGATAMSKTIPGNGKANPTERSSTAWELARKQQDEAIAKVAAGITAKSGCMSSVGVPRKIAKKAAKRISKKA